MADVKMSDMTADSSVAGTEKLLALDGTTSKTMTPVVLANYVIDTYLAAASTATPTTGDYVLGFRSTDEKRFALADVVTYGLNAAFDSSAITTPASGDFVLVEQLADGVRKVITAANFASYVLGVTAAKTTILNVSTLDAASLSSGDYLLICESTTPKQTTLGSLETQFWTDFATYEAALDAATVADGDKFYLTKSGTPKHATGTALATYIQTKIAAAVVDDVWDGDLVSPALTGDMLVAERTATKKTMTVDTVSNFCTAALAASAALGAFTTGNYLLTFDGTTPKRGTIQNSANYAISAALASTATSPILTADILFGGRSAVAKTFTIDVVKTFVLDGIQATVCNLATLSTEVSSFTTATDRLLVEQGGVGKYCHVADFETQLWADYKTYVGALDPIGSVDDADYFYGIDGAGPTAKKVTALKLATYVIEESWTADAAASVTSGDYFLSYRSGTGARKATVDQFSTWLFTSAQTTILDIDGLTTATLAGTEYIPCQQGTAPANVKKTTVAALATYTLSTLATAVAALTEITTLADADIFYVVQGGSGKYTTLEDIVDYVEASIVTDRWTLVSGSVYTATPASTSTITFSDTTGLAPGMPIKYTYGAVTYYGIITAVTTDTLVTIAGATLNTGVAITALYVSSTERALQVDMTIGGPYDGGSTADLLATVAKRYFKWQKADAYLVKFSATHALADTGAQQPKINVKIAGNLVCTNDSSNGIQLSTAGAWVDTIDSVPVAISTSYYDIVQDDAIEIAMTVDGTNNNAESLTVSMVFVYE